MRLDIVHSHQSKSSYELMAIMDKDLINPWCTYMNNQNHSESLNLNDELMESEIQTLSRKKQQTKYVLYVEMIS